LQLTAEKRGSSGRAEGDFLAVDFDVQNMASAVDGNLYRNRR
jgi:hypothetical protein